MARFAPAQTKATAPKGPRCVAPKRKAKPNLRDGRAEGAFSLAAVATQQGEPIQAKLKIGEPDDQFEKEADQIADQVMRMPDRAAVNAAPPTSGDSAPLSHAGTGATTVPVPAHGTIESDGQQPDEKPEEEASAVALQRTAETAGGAAPPGDDQDDDVRTHELPHVQRACAKCSTERDDESGTLQRIPAPGSRVQSMCAKCEKDEEMQRRISTDEEELQRSSSESNGAPPDFADALSVARSSGGQPLPGSLRAFMERRFDKDFSGVRVHRDMRADGLTRSVSARAFTVGHDLFFRRGEFQPGTQAGRHLIAHELTHTLQQQGSLHSVSEQVSTVPAQRATLQRKQAGEVGAAEPRPEPDASAAEQGLSPDTNALEPLARVPAPPTPEASQLGGVELSHAAPAPEPQAPEPATLEEFDAQFQSLAPEDPQELTSIESQLDQTETQEPLTPTAEGPEQPSAPGLGLFPESEAVSDLRQQVATKSVEIELLGGKAKESVHIATEEQRARVAAVLTAERQALAASTGEQRAQVAATAEATRRTIVSARDAEIEDTRKAAEVESEHLKQAIANKIVHASEVAELKAREAFEFGEKQAVRMETQTKANIAEVRAIGARVVSRYSASARAARIQVVVAEKVAGTTGALRDTGVKMAAKARADGLALAQKIRADADAIGRKFRAEAEPAALAQIQQERDKSIEGTQRMAQTPLDQLEGLANAMAGQLESSQQDAQRLLDRLLGVATADLGTGETRANALIDSQTGQALAELNGFVIEAGALLAPNPPALARRRLAELSPALDDGVTAYSTGLDKAVIGIESKLVGRADAVASQSSDRATGSTKAVSGLAGAVQGKLEGMAATVSEDLNSLTSAGTKNMAAVTTRTEQDLESAIQQKDGIWGDQVAKGTSEIKGQIDQALEKQADIVRNFGPDLESDAKGIDEESGFLRALKIVAGFVVGVVIAAVLAAIVAIAVYAILALGAALLGVAIGLLLLGGGFAVLGGILLAVVLVAAVVGVGYAIYGIYKGVVEGWKKYQRAATDQSLDDFQAGVIGGEGAAEVILSLLPLVGGLRAALRGGLKRLREPIIETPGEARLGAGEIPKPLAPKQALAEVAEAEQAAAETKAGAEKAAAEAEGTDRYRPNVEATRSPDQPAPPPRPSYDPTGRTQIELEADSDPSVRAGENPVSAAERSRLAQDEIIRRQVDLFHALGEEPRPVDIAAEDALHSDAHTIDRHGPEIPLRQADNPGGRTIEGRILGDPPWPRPANASARWLSRAELKRTLNEYLRANWDAVRSDLAEEGVHEALFDAHRAVGEGFFNSGMFGQGPIQPQYAKTSLVTITIRLIPGPPPRYYVVRAFPNLLGRFE